MPVENKEQARGTEHCVTKWAFENGIPCRNCTSLCGFAIHRLSCSAKGMPERELRTMSPGRRVWARHSCNGFQIDRWNHSHAVIAWENCPHDDSCDWSLVLTLVKERPQPLGDVLNLFC